MIDRSYLELKDSSLSMGFSSRLRTVIRRVVVTRHREPRRPDATGVVVKVEFGEIGEFDEKLLGHRRRYGLDIGGHCFLACRALSELQRDET